MLPSEIPTIVVVCGDPGGANAVAPVILKLIEESKVNVVAFAYREACRLWNEKKIPFIELPDSTTYNSVLNILKENNAILLFTGTSWNPQEFEKQFIRAARARSIPSLALLDYPSYYAIRFSDNAGNLVYLPDKIAVMDEATRDEMIREGFDQEIITITGQPAYDDLGLWKERFTPDQREAIRKDLGINHNNLLVVFASEPIFSGNEIKISNPGYSRDSVLKSIIGALDQIQKTYNKKITLVICPHPREDKSEFTGIEGKTIPVVISTTGHTREIVMAADLVLGMSTAMLVEACYLGCIVVSIQPGLTFADILPTNRMGYSHPVYRDEDIIPVIQTMLLDEDRRKKTQEKTATLNSDGKATDRVIQQIYLMAGII